MISMYDEGDGFTWNWYPEEFATIWMGITWSIPSILLFVFIFLES